MKRKYAIIGLITIMCIIGVIFLKLFSGHDIRDVNSFFLDCETRHGWAIEFGAYRESDSDYSIPIVDPPESLYDYIDEKERFYVINTPHYMVFANVYHRQGTVTHVEFSGPDASKAVRSISKDMEQVLPNLRYTVIDGP